jgi:hypothetical protein
MKFVSGKWTNGREIREKRVWREISSSDDETRADGFRFAIDRQNFTAATALLRILSGA